MVGIATMKERLRVLPPEEDELLLTTTGFRKSSCSMPPSPSRAGLPGRDGCGFRMTVRHEEHLHSDRRFGGDFYCSDDPMAAFRSAAAQHRTRLTGNYGPGASMALPRHSDVLQGATLEFIAVVARPLLGLLATRFGDEVSRVRTHKSA